MVRHGSTGATPVSNLDESINQNCEITIRKQINNMLNKTNTTDKNVLCIISGVVELLLDQKEGIRTALDEITQSIQAKNERIDALESKIIQLQEEISSIKPVGDANIANADPPSSQSSDKSFDMFAQVQDRATRSENLMIFNIVENTSNDTNVRVNHDKTHVSDILSQLEAQQVGEYKVVRVGKSGDRPRPIKVIFSDAHAVSQCLRSKYKIRESNIKIKPDLTVMQRGHLKSLFEELDRRKNDDECPDKRFSWVSNGKVNHLYCKNESMQIGATQQTG
ncbi:unnamed protein product [Ceutorhynchus assimilis]|uniref:Uncharacterized protein n=1 Tax=Ceutorhynchus assimilis TaxID=467358 RepID=A0A9N9QDM8_9CUCU|nr:unnamed protein product [Ceutorhynchus assimilis]